MPGRSLLRRQLRTAWDEAIKAYNAQWINTESDLQFRLCHALLCLFDRHPESENRRRIYQQATLRKSHFIKSLAKTRHPDVVICDTRDRIIGIVELKYTPRAKPSVDKDVSSLEWYMEEGVAFLPERYRGDGTAMSALLVAEDAVLCWAGIYASDRTEHDLEEKARGNLSARTFLPLHAKTAHGQAAKVPGRRGALP